jgi:hypothetical protein
MLQLSAHIVNCDRQILTEYDFGGVKIDVS